MQNLEKIIDGLGAYICDDLCYYRETSMDKNDEEMEAICSGCKAGEYLEAIRNYINDGWIPVEKELPPLGQRLQATILHHEWISDYDHAWVPEEEKILHPAYTEVCEIVMVDGMWFYFCKEDDYLKDIAYIKPKKNLSVPISEIIAWRLPPEPYSPEPLETRKNSKEGVK